MLYLAFILLTLEILEPSVRYIHVRPMSAPARELIDAAIRRSPSLVALLERIERSDVVVYLYTDHARSSALDGSLGFLSRAGGYRYVQVRVTLRSRENRNIATLAHELQHAVEIAERPGIVDQATLARTYAQIGHAKRLAHGARRGFDTIEAIAAGQRASREAFGY